EDLIVIYAARQHRSNVGGHALRGSGSRRLQGRAIVEDFAIDLLLCSAELQDILNSAHVVLIEAKSQPDKWQAALAAIDQEQRRIQEFG
ncbi:hypothetical protein ACEQ6A_34910, partial [Rhizobium brockwellii]|uniref:hypothetical protein n=1 Tax=Rhizobium brockwellii TaxID=3019932 RepID=UPI003F9B0A0D